MLQILTVSTPLRIVGVSRQTNSLTRRLNPMAGHHLIIIVGNGLQHAWLVGNTVPAYLVAHLRVFRFVLFLAQTPAIQQQFHFIAIGIGNQRQLLPLNTVPMVAHTVVARLHAVPHLVSLTVNHRDMRHRLVGHEERLHIVGLRLRLQGDVEHALRPTLGWPALRLTQVVDGAPVGQSDNAVEIHLEVVLPHSGHRGLALVERHPGESAPVAWEVHIAVVISLHVGHHRQVARQRVGLPVAVAGVHGHRHQARRVVALQQGLLEFEHGDAEVVERLVGVLLQLVAETPQHDGR